MTRVSSRLSLVHLTMIEADPLELMEAAHAGGFDSIALRIVSPQPTDRMVPVIGNDPLIRQIERRRAETGVDILYVDGIWLTPETMADAYAPAFETAARLGAESVQVVGDDPDDARVTQNFAHLCEQAERFGLKLVLEFLPYFHTATLAAAHRLVLRAGQPNAGLVIDSLHLSRSGGHPDDLRAVDPALLTYCQLSDAPAVAPPRDQLRAEARTARLYPGRGKLPLAALLDALPAGIPIGTEAPCLEYADRPIIERGRLCGAATREFLKAYRARLQIG